MLDKKFRFRLKGKTAVFIDWANVYGWNKHRHKPVDPRKLHIYLKSYRENFTDPKQKNFTQEV